MFTRDSNHAGDLALCCRVMRGVSHLPLLPLKSWCNRAAALLSPLMPEAMVAVALVEDHPVRHLVRVPVAGLSVGAARSKRANGKGVEKVERRLTDDRWNTLMTNGYSGVRHVAAEQVPARSVVFEVEEFHGGIIVGCAPCDPPGRQIVMHAMFDRAPDPHTPLGVLNALMIELGMAASAAFAGDASYRNLVTRQEELIVEMLTQGLTVPEISTRVSRSRHTVHDHIKKLHAKTGISTRGELVARALGHFPVPPEHKTPPVKAPSHKPATPKATVIKATATKPPSHKPGASKRRGT